MNARELIDGVRWVTRDRWADDAPRPPRVRMDLRAPVPGVAVRLLPGLLVLVVAALTGLPTEIVGTFAVPAAVIAVVRPRWPVVPFVVVGAAVGVLAGPDLLTGPGGLPTGDDVGRLAALSVAVHLLVRGAALAGHVAWRGVVEGPVLLRALRSVLLVQAGVLALAVLAAALRWVVGTAGDAGGVLRAIAVTAAVVAALVAVPRSWWTRPPRP